MKILFAVSNENVLNRIVESYKAKYGETISFKNVFYFNAIIRELQRDKTYDRVVISEDLEPFSNNNYDIIDRFIVERLQEISFNAENDTGKKINIIIICTDRRTKSSFVLTKMFEFGIFDALVGTDRRIDNVCNLIKEPRTADEAKEYYKIEGQINTQTVDDVSEQEVQNILIHYKKLGKNEERYVDSFNNIAAQYTDKQLKIIIKCLPINVRAVLEAESPKYQELVTYANETPEERKEREKAQEQRRLEQLENEKKLKEKIEKDKKEKERQLASKPNNVQTQSYVPPQLETRKTNFEKKSNQEGIEIDLLENKRREQKVNGDVIIPNNMNIKNERKIYSDEDLVQMQSSQREGKMGNIQTPQQIQPVQQQVQDNDLLSGFEDLQDIQTTTDIQDTDTINQNTHQLVEQEEPILEETTQLQIEDVANQEETEQPVKRGRGRPRKYPIEPPKPKGKRGRPRKYPLPEENMQTTQEENLNENMLQELPSTVEDSVTEKAPILPEVNDFDNVLNEPNIDIPDSLPGFEDIDSNQSIEDNLSVLPGIDDYQEEDDDDSGNDILSGLPGLEEESIETLQSNATDDQFLQSMQNKEYMPPKIPTMAENINNNVSTYSPSEDRIESIKKLEENKIYSTGSLNTVLTKEKKIVAFVGASKSGTSFLVNNLACLFSSLGVKTAILDMTKNKNSYYIYTNNDENLRNVAYTSIERLENGEAEGIRVDRNLEVYTAMPNDGKDYSNAEAILSTLIQNVSVVLIDCDFDTSPGYFANAQEIYLVQSMDILTIQPLTGFLRDLKTKGILEQEKLRVVINKEIKVRNLSSKAVIGGMSFYNDPAMSYMTELFNKDKTKACSIPFDEGVYARYLEAMVNCSVSISGYSKSFMNSLKILGSMVYPLQSRQTYGGGKTSAEMNYGNNFSTEMNNTLNQMKNKY